MTRKKSLTTNIVANFLGYSSAVLTGLVFTPFYIRYLGIESYGLIGFYLTLQGAMGFLDLGLSRSCNREVARLSGKGKRCNEQVCNTVRTLEVVYAAIGLLILLILLGLNSYLSTNWINSSEFTSTDLSVILVAISVVISLRWPLSIYGGALKGLERHVSTNLIKICSSFACNGGAVLLLAFYSSNIVVFFYWQIFCSAITLMIYIYFTWLKLPGSFWRAHFDLDIIKDIYKFAGGLSLSVLLGTVIMQYDKIALSKMLPLEEYSYYMILMVLVKPLIMIASAFSSAFFPRLSFLIGQGESEKTINRLYDNLTYISNSLIITVSMILVFYGDDVLRIYTDKSDIPVELCLVLGVFAFAKMIRANKMLPYSTQLAYGWTSLGVKLDISSLVILIISFHYFVPNHGMLGAAYSWLLMTVIYFLLNYFYMHKQILKSLKVTWIFSNLIIPTTLCIIVFGIIRLVVYVQSSFLALLLSTVLSCVLSLVVLISYKMFLRVYFLDILKRALIR